MRKLLMSLWCSLLLLSGNLIAQTRTLTGKVTDADGKPVANASVTVKGTKVGTITDTDGSYSLNVPVGAKTLVISSVNMQQEEIKINTVTNYDLTLQPQNVSMDEVVVVGYGTIDKRSLTGSVSKVNGAALANKPVTSFDQALTGKAAGVLVNTSSGLVGDDVVIRIRGGASVSMGGYPLIIMDGVPITQGRQMELANRFNALAEINPNDIESIEVLKDAAATAIYGSRGSAGVLLITTKKGKTGTTSLNYDNYIGYNEPARKLKMLNAADYIATINTLKTNAGAAPTAFYGDINNDGKLDTVNTDWQNEVFRKGQVQNHNMAISGGSQNTTYFASLNYNENEGYIKRTGQKRGSARLNLTSRVTDWLQFGVNTQYSSTQARNIASGAGSVFAGIPYGPFTAFPNIPVYGPDGKYYTGNGGNKDFTAYLTPNPLAVTQMNYEDRDARRFIASAFGELQPVKGLKLKSQVNVDYSSAYIDGFWNKDIGDGVQLGGLRQTNYNEKNTWSWFNTANYTRQIGADHELNVLAGAEYTRRTSKYAYKSGVGIINPDLLIIDPANYQDIAGYDGIDNIDDGLASYFGWVNYGFRKKYLATFSYRRDADSRFGKDNRWGSFPSGSVAWRMTEEDFMRTISFVNDLKLRASYGVTGNSNIGYFPGRGTITPGTYADIPVLTLSNPGNSALRWERHLQFDAGFDAVLWKQTSITLEYYNRKTIDLILNNPVLATLGFPGNLITENVGKLRSQGVELSVTTPVLHTRKFTWDINFNTAWNKTKVVATNVFGDDLYDNNDSRANYAIARPGQPLGVFYLIRWAGVNPVNGLPTFLDVNGNQKQYDKSASTANAWTMVKDGSITTPITATDRVLSNKTPYPKLYGGISQTFSYSNFDAAIDLQYALGFSVYNQTMQNMLKFDNINNKSTEILNAWKKAGDNTDVPRLFANDAFWTTTASTRWLEKGDFLRVRNVQIGYTIPKAITQRAKISRLRFYVQGSNLYTFTGYSGIDPEANSVGETNIGMGIDKFRPYLTRTFTMGINLGL